jgi:hypothetical protein
MRTKCFIVSVLCLGLASSMLAQAPAAQQRTGPVVGQKRKLIVPPGYYAGIPQRPAQPEKNP